MDDLHILLITLNKFTQINFSVKLSENLCFQYLKLESSEEVGEGNSNWSF